MSVRSLYNWALRQAEQDYAPWLLFTLAMIEPCLLPIPPDTLLIPMSIARRDKAIRFATICTIGSVIGGLLGYGIGAVAMATVGQWIVDTYHLQGAFELFRNGFQKWGAWIILAKGFTPLPFILVAVASGLTHLPLHVFILSATVTRGARFFLEAFLIRRFGEPMRLFIEKYLTLIAMSVLLLIVAGFYLILQHH